MSLFITVSQLPMGNTILTGKKYELVFMNDGFDEEYSIHERWL